MANLTLDEPLFGTFVFYASVLAMKTLFMSIWTLRHRLAKKIYPLPEDYERRGLKAKPIGFIDEDIERVRRSHLNDLENVLPFLIIGFLFVLTEPNIVIAKWIFRLFTLARFSFTLGYLNGIPFLRGICGFIPGMLCNVVMTVMVMRKAFGNL